MNWLETLLTPALVRAVGYTLLHSLWQGALVALALAGLLLLLRRHSAQVRYSVTAASLGLILLLAGVTFMRYYLTAAPASVATSSEAWVQSAAADAMATVAPAAEHPLSKKVVLAYIEHNLPLIVTVWLLGLLTMTLRLLGGLAYVQRLRHYGTRPLGLAWQHRLANLSERAGLKRPVALLESSLVRVPVVVGHLKPMILLPLGAVAGLSPMQMEAILAHELAHVARRDYLVNIIQSIAEILFFYHPAVWFLTATLRSERENCCDDVAASLCGDPLVLARALAALAELGLERAVAPRLTMAAVGPQGSLLGRVRRLVQRRGAPTFSEGFLAACVVMMGIVLLSISAVAALAHPHLAAAAPRLLRQAMPAFITQPDIKQIEATVAETAALTDATCSSDDDDDDRKRKRKAKNKGESRVIVLDREVNRRGGPGSVIIEKDKKGRLTDLYVNGERVETSSSDRRGGKKDNESRVEVIQVPSGSGYAHRYIAPGRYEYSFDSEKFEKEFKDKFGKDFDKKFYKLDKDFAKNFKYQRLEDGQTRVFRLGPDGQLNPQVYVDAEGITRNALREAERGLEKARQQADLSEADRERIEQQLEKIRDQRQDLEESRHEAEERVRERDEARREAEADRREAEAERREEAARAREERAREREERAREREERNREVEEKLVGELRRDGLITDTNNFTFQLTSSRLTVNGKEQPEAMLRKYLGIYKELNERDLNAGGSMTITRNNTNRSIIYNSTGTPAPAAPRPPRAPRPSVAPTAPKAPRTPRAPRTPKTTLINSVDVRSALVRDQIIEDDDNTLQFRLNNNEMVVNGKKQPADVAARYRKLLGGTEGSNVNMDIVVNND
ncbi:M48 family metalloprotease [Hymenobacter busanensis]|uniref:M48 family metalloprotease n=1 Tax=Hymenobacter busanensis TaxID=2607656 RepID=A0A7L5A2H3_9BACT|nr:M56 family metallopeptidase [Hymenobacter busanensis]KAA9338349.1 M48 family metalloprotease [Hymenobacter busanensis]QHJ09225.1 M48 family metalloprotease [Hymenobacter busanensis]